MLVFISNNWLIIKIVQLLRKRINVVVLHLIHITNTAPVKIFPANTNSSITSWYIPTAFKVLRAQSRIWQFLTSNETFFRNQINTLYSEKLPFPFFSYLRVNNPLIKNICMSISWQYVYSYIILKNNSTGHRAQD